MEKYSIIFVQTLDEKGEKKHETINQSIKRN